MTATLDDTPITWLWSDSEALDREITRRRADEIPPIRFDPDLAAALAAYEEELEHGSPAAARLSNGVSVPLYCIRPGCGKRMRPNGTKAIEHPGTVLHYGNGVCSTCDKKDRRHAKRKKEQELAAA